MGALCCAHNREPIASTDEEQEGLTAVDDDSKANDEPELEYPDKQPVAGQLQSKSSDDDIKQDSNNEFICDSIENCQCILNIEQIMKYYISWISQRNNPSKTNNISIIHRIKDSDKNNYKKTMYCYIHQTFGQTYHEYNYSNVSLINDFNHILFKHNNDHIHINKLFDSETNHFIVTRNNRDPSQFEQCIKMYFDTQQIDEIHTQQLCDKIYCFLFDNIIYNENEKKEEEKEEKEELNALINSHQHTEDDDDEIDEYIYINKELLGIQNISKKIKNNFVKLRGFDRINNKNKFYTNIENNNNSFSEIFAFKYYYWSYYQNKPDTNTDWFVHKTYLTLKEEILSHSIELIQFNLLLKTATNYIHSNHCKYAMICNTDEWEIKYGICKGDGITVPHIIAILLYCNNDSFTTELLQTYRKLNMAMEETDNSLKLRHAKFYFTAKYLTELVDCFATANIINEVECYYHIINENVICSDEMSRSRIKCPFSATNKYLIAYINANSDNGLILQLQNKDNIKCFDCKWITDFVAEDEKLFNGWNGLILNTIISIKNGLCSDYKIYLNALYIIKEIMDGKFYRNEDKYNMDKTVQTVVQRLITNKIYTVYTDWETLPIYIEKLTNYYFSTLQKVNINYKSIKQCEENGGYQFLEKLLLQSNDNNNLSFVNVDIFKSLFPELKDIIINFSDCNCEEYCVDCKLFEYILLHLKSVNKWNEISIVFHANNYQEQTLSDIINLYKDQFESFNWKLKRESYQNTITILNNKPSIAFVFP